MYKAILYRLCAAPRARRSLLSFFLSFPFAAWTLCGLQRLELYARGLCQAQRDPLRSDRLRILLVHRVTNFGLRPQSVSPHDNFAQDR